MTDGSMVTIVGARRGDVTANPYQPSSSHPHHTTYGACTIDMWPPFERARRRLLGGTIARHPAGPDDAESADIEQSQAGDVVLTIGRGELERLGAALQAFLGPQVARPDTPARLEAALAIAVERLGGVGRPRVTRRPPGLYTPEAWQVRLSKIDPAIGEAIREAARGLGFSA